jgi:hypothetical protein
MATWRGWRVLARCGLAALIGTQAGCLSFCNPVIPPPPEEVAACAEVAQCQKNKVYIFFIHGCDPLDLSNFAGLREYLHSLGYIKTYFGNSYHTFHFQKELCKLRKDQPDARFVLVGFGHGAGMARDLACSVRVDGIDIDLVVYIDGGEPVGRPLHRPCKVLRAVNVVSCKKAEYEVKDADNHLYDDIGHHATATDKRTLGLMARELAEVARRVPIVVRQPPAMTPVGPSLPMPKEISNVRGEWDFLRPDEHALSPHGLPPTDQALGAPPATMPRR